MEEKRIEALQFLTNRYIENVWKHTGIHLLATGWILSSAQLQLMLAHSTLIQLGLTIIFAILQSVHSFINIPIFHLIKKLEVEINDDANGHLAEYYGVSNFRFILNEVMIASIALFAVIFIWFSPYSNQG